MITSVPRRAVGRMAGLALRAIGVLLFFMMLIELLLLTVHKCRRCSLVDVVAKRAQPAHDHWRDDNADPPCNDDQDDRHGELQKRRTHTASRCCAPYDSSLR